jgi:hypothetical protein
VPSGRALESHVKGGSYTDQEVERGLVALALCSGNSRRAARLLEDRGLPIPRSTLKQWPDLYPDHYSAVQAQVLPELKARLAEEHTALADLERGLRDLFNVPANEPLVIAGEAEEIEIAPATKEGTEGVA